jgi:mediator of RNA polymerase II transcription subunit 7
LLVSEFPPPPFYYYRAAAAESSLPPPAIPDGALRTGTRRAAAAAARARAEAERNRLGGGGDDGADRTDSILGGVPAGRGAAEEEEEEGDVVAVFGEIVEDPLLVEPQDRCEDPTVVREEVKKLNQQVLQGFVKLVDDLVNNPVENKYVNRFFELNCSATYLFLIRIPLPFFQKQKDTRRAVSQRLSHAPRV